MPIRPEMRARYPRNWREIREQILARAGGRCEQCGVPQYAVGYRDARGRFVPTGGTQLHDAAGAGYLPYAEARELVVECNEWQGGLTLDGRRALVIVLTVAHHPDPDPANCDPGNLHALCQSCHLRLDREQHRRTAAETRRRKRQQSQPALWDPAP